MNLKKYYYYWKTTINLIWRVKLKIIVIIVIINIIINKIKKNIITIEKNHKFDLKGKIKDYRNFEKMPMEKNKKSKVEGSNWKT